MCSNTIKKVLCLLICFIFWLYALPCFASRNGEQTIALLQNNSVAINDVLQVDIVNDNAEQLQNIRANLLPVIQDCKLIVANFLRDGGNREELMQMLMENNTLFLLQTLIATEERLLRSPQLDNEYREAAQETYEENRKFLQKLIAEDLVARENVVRTTAQNNDLQDRVDRLEEGNPPCHCLKLIDQAISSSTCHCVNPDLAHRLPRKFWYGVASGVVVTSIGLTILYHFI